jgi:peptidoglycan/xylan/chitin deacetylase (PgdA/CDA1 family)
MKAIVDAGHAIGMHSVTHVYEEIYASEEAFFNDLYKMQGIIEKATGVKSTLMRFPGGSSNKVSKFNPGIMTKLTKAVTDQGFQYFDWNVSSGDAGETKDTDRIVSNVINGIGQKKYAVVLQHDIYKYSVDAVEQILIWGIQNGYSFQALTPSSPTCHHPVNN